MAKKSRTPLGERLKEAKDRSGLTAEQIAEALGVSPAAVWAWWAGRNEPSLTSLVEYARIVGTTLEYLAGADRPMKSPQEKFADWILEFVDRVKRGEHPEAAADAVVGQPDYLSPRERRLVRENADALQAFIQAQTDRPISALSDAERLALYDRLMGLAPPGDNP